MSPRNALIARLRELRACPDAVAWVETLPPDATIQSAWDICLRADWMMWMMRRWRVEYRSPLHLAFVLCTCDIADAVAHLIREPAATRANLAVVRAWCGGTATDAEQNSARKRLWAAEDDTDDDTTEGAAAYAASSAGEAAAEAGYAIARAVDAAEAAASASPTLRARLADIVRRHFPQAPEMKP